MESWWSEEKVSDAFERSCWIGAYDEDKVKQLLGIPESLRVVSLLSLGYPVEKPASQTIRQRRKPLAQILHYEKYTK